MQKIILTILLLFFFNTTHESNANIKYKHKEVINSNLSELLKPLLNIKSLTNIQHNELLKFEYDLLNKDLNRLKLGLAIVEIESKGEVDIFVSNGKGRWGITSACANAQNYSLKQAYDIKLNSTIGCNYLNKLFELLGSDTAQIILSYRYGVVGAKDKTKQNYYYKKAINNLSKINQIIVYD